MVKSEIAACKEIFILVLTFITSDFNNLLERTVLIFLLHAFICVTRNN